MPDAKIAILQTEIQNLKELMEKYIKEDREWKSRVDDKLSDYAIKTISNSKDLENLNRVVHGSSSGERGLVPRLSMIEDRVKDSIAEAQVGKKVLIFIFTGISVLINIAISLFK